MSPDDTFEATLGQVADLTSPRTFTLPSRGYLYPADSPLRGGEVHVRPMRHEDALVLMDPPSKKYDAFDRLIMRCVSFPDSKCFKQPSRLLSHDRMALVLFIRLVTLGPVYEGAVNCPRCGHYFKGTVNLEGDLEVRYCDTPEIAEPFSTILPITKLCVEYRLPRAEDDRVVYDFIARGRKKPNWGIDTHGLLFRIERLVTDIKGCSNEDERTKILNLLPTRDLYHLRSLVNLPPFGVVPAVDIECPKCIQQSRCDLRLDVSFLCPGPDEPRVRKIKGESILKDPND